MSGRNPNDRGLVAVDLATCITPQELLVTVAAEWLGEDVGVGPVLLKGLDHRGSQK